MFMITLSIVDANKVFIAPIEQALGAAEKGDTIMTMGAGDIYKVADALVLKK